MAQKKVVGMTVTEIQLHIKKNLQNEIHGF